ncbi:helix-turn-helix domain-containing protein [Alkalibacter saccharofermentans]|uniref:Helix-turn-helix domain-containing protein n=1 Tax=Alkalibacter saccharofermentans DSM 14828 TaxID=1120975 RepID=A0A1M4ZPC2_9FIRM|nr:helix-turn-helix domain-containing protein [Alkalibacter saccharofermentans]SHF19416.1 Helix-turn-helix domain-containing protein [Alkalibacter saccharofermentans DSM 14828]
MKSKIKAMIHPIRMRIIQALLDGKEMTAGEIAETLQDIPQASLYRHINALLKEEILTVVSENRIRGTVEKVFSLSATLENATEKEMEEASREDHFNYFFSFLMGLLGEYEEYLQEEIINMREDGVSFRQCSVYLSDEEFMALMKDIGGKLMAAMKNEPSKNRRLRTIANVVIPSKKNKEK